MEGRVRHRPFSAGTRFRPPPPIQCLILSRFSLDSWRAGRSSRGPLAQTFRMRGEHAEGSLF